MEEKKDTQLLISQSIKRLLLDATKKHPNLYSCQNQESAYLATVNQYKIAIAESHRFKLDAIDSNLIKRAEFFSDTLKFGSANVTNIPPQVHHANIEELKVFLPDVSFFALAVFDIYCSDPLLWELTGVRPVIVPVPSSEYVLKLSAEERGLSVSLLGTYAGFLSTMGGYRRIVFLFPPDEQYLVRPVEPRINEKNFIMPEKSSAQIDVQNKSTSSAIKYIDGFPGQIFSEILEFQSPGFIWPPFSEVAKQSPLLEIGYSSQHFFSFLTTPYGVYTGKASGLLLQKFLSGVIACWKRCNMIIRTQNGLEEITSHIYHRYCNQSSEWYSGLSYQMEEILQMLPSNNLDSATQHDLSIILQQRHNRSEIVQENRSAKTYIKETVTTPTSVLFVSAGPRDKDEMRIRNEYRLVAKALKEENNKSFELLQPQPALRITDLLDAILTFSPNIIHFSCHGSENGEIYFEGDDEQSIAVDPKTLDSLFKASGNIPECVILNSCFSGKNVEGIAKHIKRVIVVKTEISDECAISFSVGFYKALAKGKSIDEAFEIANAYIKVSGHSDEYLLIKNEYARK